MALFIGQQFVFWGFLSEAVGFSLLHIIADLNRVHICVTVAVLGPVDAAFVTEA